MIKATTNCGPIESLLRLAICRVDHKKTRHIRILSGQDFVRRVGKNQVWPQEAADSSSKAFDFGNIIHQRQFPWTLSLSEAHIFLSVYRNREIKMIC